VLTKFINEGLVPNKDFVLVFNDGNLYDSPYKQDLVYRTLSTARTNAFSRIISDADAKAKLNEIGINGPSDIQILLGAETHTQLDGQRNDGIRIPPPTDVEIASLSAKFESLGGILMTEVNPEGTAEQQAEFIKRISSLLMNDDSLEGILLWHVFSPDDPSDIWGRQKLGIFDNNGTSTQLYYALLGSK
jgi:hypothetical protein